MKNSKFSQKTNLELFDLFCSQEDAAQRMAIVTHFYEIHNQKLNKFINKNYKDLDDDLIDDIILDTFYKKFYHAIPKYKDQETPIANVEAFLTTAAKRLALTKLAEMKRKPLLNKQNHVSLYQNEKNNFVEGVENTTILGLVDTQREKEEEEIEISNLEKLLAQVMLCLLIPTQAEVIFLHKIKGLKFKAIATQLNLSIEQVEGRIDRGNIEMKNLKEMIGNIFDITFELPLVHLILVLQNLDIIKEAELVTWREKLTTDKHLLAEYTEVLRLVFLFFPKEEALLTLRYLTLPKEPNKKVALFHLKTNDRTESNRKLAEKNIKRIKSTIKNWQYLFNTVAIQTT
jgi:RNA polymerase sigma factor (sigma-70 family)